jgi:nucleotide-binding universal stress UspA family protein
MSIVVADLDTTAAARTVLETALRMAELTGARIEAVHVRDGDLETPRVLARRANIPLRLVDGPEGLALVAVLSDPEVLAGVIGARSAPGGRQPLGHTAEYVIEHADKAVVVVPPEAVEPRTIRRILVPLEGTDATSGPVVEHVHSLLGSSSELIVLHVFTDATLPAMLDRPEYDFEILGKEFLARHLPEASRIELRPGPIARRVLEVSHQMQVDLIVMSWEQRLSADRARVVADVLASSPIPIVLLPARRARRPGAVRVPGSGERVLTGYTA